jgi:hypothetical protein
MRLWFRIVLAVLSCALLPVPRLAAASDWFTITSCDTVTVRGLPAEQVSFVIHNLDSQTIYQFGIEPDHSVPQDTCHAFTATAPSTWNAQLSGDNGVVWTVRDLNAVIKGGTSLGGFSAIISRPSCCFVAGFAAATGIFDGAAWCVVCPLATPARASTWGVLKAGYR